MQPNKFETTINLKTTTALGLTAPAALFTGADEDVASWPVPTTASVFTSVVGDKSNIARTALDRRD
jgi:hypothetical protein